jgi:hypothetical protein
MFAFLTRSRRPAARSVPVRPRLEGLESRFCPSSLTLNYSYGSQTTVNFYGQYSGGQNPANQVVTIAGSNWSVNTTTDAGGNYSRGTPVTTLGQVTASVADPASNKPTVKVNPPAPQITNFTAVQDYGLEEFSGTITGTPNPSGMTVIFGGLSSVAGQTTTVGNNSQFSAAFNMNGQTGNVSALTTDWWGQVSNTAWDWVS